MKDYKKELQMQYTDMFGNVYQVLPKLNTYANNGNLYVGLDFFDKEFGFWEPYTDVTVNVSNLPYLESAIDINDNGNGIISFLIQNGFGELTEKSLESGFCAFPVFRFNPEKLKEIDADFFEAYAKSHSKNIGICVSLNEQISAATHKNDISVNNQPKIDDEPSL